MSSGRLARNAVSSAGQIVVSAALLFEQYRFAIQHVSLSEIGVWSLVVAGSAIGRLADLGFGNGVVRFIAVDAGSGDSRRAAATLGMAAATVGVVLGILCILLYPGLQILLGRVITDPTLVAAASDLLPFGLASLWMTMLAGLFSGALDGLQRMDLRATITVAAGVVQLICVYALVPATGVSGLAIAQLVHGGIVLLVSASVAYLLLGEKARAWMRFERERARQMLAYGGGLQIATVGQMLFDPTVKMLLAVFGGLAMTGYFELASRIILQFRAVIVSAFQALVPYIASGNRDPAETATVYGGTYGFLIFLAMPYYALIVLVLPPLLSFWTGEADLEFLMVAYITLAGWVANTLVGPAYFLYLAVGRIRWPVASQLLIGVLNLVLGLLGGWVAGGIGVLAASSTALGIGSFVVVLAFHREFRVPLPGMIPPESVVLIAVCAITAALAIFLGYQLTVGAVELFEYALGSGLLAGMIFLVAWRNPNRIVFFRLLRRVIPN